MFYNRRRLMIVLVAGLVLGVGVFFVWALKAGKIKIGADVPKQGVEKMTRPEYVPGEFIVKLKPKASASKDAIGVTAQSIEPIFKDDLAGAPASVKAQPKSDNLSRYYKLKVDLGDLAKSTGGSAKPAGFKTKLQNQPEQEAVRDPSDPTARDRQDAFHQSTLERLSANPNVESASLNYIRKTQWDPNDPYYRVGYDFGTGYDAMWGLKNLSMRTAWDLSKGAGVVVAVSDTGIDINHEDLAGNILKDGSGQVIGYNFVDNNSDVMDRYGHGTHVAGTIAAVSNNGIGVASMAPETKLMPVKGLDDRGSGSDSNLAQTIKFAADHGAKVLNMSWGGMGTDQVIEDALKYASDKGVISVAAAGNSSEDAGNFFPAGSPYVITVGAYDPYEKKASFSNYGPSIEVVAPGVDILSTVSAINKFPANKIVAGKYARLDGTSMAAPHVSGLAALEIAKNPTWQPSQIQDSVIHTAKDLGDPGKDEWYGYGRIDPPVALALSAPYKVPIANLDPVPHVNRTSFDIKGSASGDNFASYRLLFRKIISQGTQPQWTEIVNSSKPVTNGVLGQFQANKIEDGRYYLKLVTTTSDGRTNEAIASFYFYANTLPGFPINIPDASWVSYPVVDKLDGQNSAVITTTFTSIKVYDRAGKMLWSKLVEITDPSDAYTGNLTAPLISDVNGDGKKEIIVGAGNGIGGYNDWVFAFDYQGNQLWKYQLDGRGFSIWNEDVLLSSDFNGDGKNEILVREWRGLDSGQIMSTNYFRLVLLDGGGKLIAKRTLFGNRKGVVECPSGAAVGDLDRDGKKEIALGCAVNHKNGAWGSGASSYLILLDGQLKNIWVKWLSEPTFMDKGGGIIFVDTNNDKKLEIAYTSNYFKQPYRPQTNNIQIFDSKGKKLNQYNLKERGDDQPGAIPVKEANTLSFVVKTENSIYDDSRNFINWLFVNGPKTGSWTYGGSVWEAAVTPLDANGDGKFEVAAVDVNRQTLKLYSGGKSIDSRSGILGFPARASLGDLNGNGKVEYLLVNSEFFPGDFPGIFAYEFAGRYDPNTLLWANPGRDPARTNDTSIPIGGATSTKPPPNVKK